MTDRLLDDTALEASSVVANNAMNRERQLAGVNSYTRELGFNPVDVLTAHLAETESVAWLDLCCGSGRALTQAAARLREAGFADRVTLVGVDLVDTFAAAPEPTLIRASITTWTPRHAFDLITCVHGLHYVGDKLAMLTRAAGWLTPTGQLVADLDLASIRLADGREAGRRLTSRLREAGYAYRDRRVTRTGPGQPHLPYTYLGADDHAGANYTGQPAVHSYYAVTE
jgi:SAM-dependent methyltransferase